MHRNSQSPDKNTESEVLMRSPPRNVKNKQNQRPQLAKLEFQDDGKF
jgi:hypothetical protein